MRFMTVMVSLAAMLMLVAAPAVAQTQAPSSPPPSSSAPSSSAPSSSAKSDMPKTKEVEGTVKKVDSATKEVKVSSGLLGLFGATLQVTDETKINVQGKEKASLTDVQEGAKVKAAYESRDGKNIAKSIDVMPAEEKPARAPAGTAPSGTTSRPPSSSPSPSTGSTTQPKTP